MLLIVLDADPEAQLNLAEQYQVIRKELEQFSTKLAKKDYLLVVNKSEQLGEEFHSPLFREYMEDRGLQKLKNCAPQSDILFISALKSLGLKSLSHEVQKQLQQYQQQEPLEPLARTTVLGNTELLNSLADSAVGSLQR